MLTSRVKPISEEKIKNRVFSCYIGGGITKDKMGISVLLIEEGDKLVRKFIYKKANTTEPRMLISSLILALQKINSNAKIDNNCSVHIPIENKYMQNTIRYWLEKWKLNNFTTHNNTTVKNRDLWEMYDEEFQKAQKKTKINYEWIEEFKTFDKWRLEVNLIVNESLNKLKVSV